MRIDPQPVITERGFDLEMSDKEVVRVLHNISVHLMDYGAVQLENGTLESDALLKAVDRLSE